MKPHRARILAMQATFQKEFHGRSEDELMKFDWIDFTPDEAELNFARRIISGTFEHQQEIDAAIVNHSKNWDFDRISPVSKSILRISLFQLYYMHSELDFKIVIDEALRLAREYAEDDAGRFINGVLDSCYKDRYTVKKN